ncbi:hypothetical protein HMPREF0556_plasmid12613 (plasmid) [Listeria grayi DSM 20601]|uniref:Uncharacterized protein n=1 Tax=Listeria grayi DSM 20601 TaxID=525367 RepID=D7V1I8_LISGR|nr:hypothetical protein HMPREF0556_plasmid12613 [Listeria grayi DSM 20601]CBV37287.1 hypothetical protein LGRDSM20601_p0062 [Listeria grayi]CBV37303.1 hypothetical protein LGRDSM20601_p0078 [Listeria grayi]
MNGECGSVVTKRAKRTENISVWQSRKGKILFILFCVAKHSYELLDREGRPEAVEAAGAEGE